MVTSGLDPGFGLKIYEVVSFVTLKLNSPSPGGKKTATVAVCPAGNCLMVKELTIGPWVPEQPVAPPVDKKST
jgi:hypothetical protein